MISNMHASPAARGGGGALTEGGADWVCMLTTGVCANGINDRQGERNKMFRPVGRWHDHKSVW